MNEDISTKPLGFRYGLILGLALIVYSLITVFAGLHKNSLMSWIPNLFFLAALIVGTRDYKSQNEGFMPFGKGLKLGLLIAFFGGLLQLVYTYIYFKFIDDSILQSTMDEAYAAIQTQDIPDDALEMVMGIYENYVFTPGGFAVASFFGTMFSGLIISLIVAAIVRKKRPDVYSA